MFCDETAAIKSCWRAESADLRAEMPLLAVEAGRAVMRALTVLSNFFGSIHLALSSMPIIILYSVVSLRFASNTAAFHARSTAAASDASGALRSRCAWAEMVSMGRSLTPPSLLLCFLLLLASWDNPIVVGVEKSARTRMGRMKMSVRVIVNCVCAFLRREVVSLGGGRAR
ncbi:hypothetical protein BDZ88DRAFT_412396 [Geranomyces variabilis]|nr:hypothetical protein BDZ88DRAFT_412396 [Geranomyces variabilis]